MSVLGFHRLKHSTTYHVALVKGNRGKLLYLDGHQGRFFHIGRFIFFRRRKGAA